MGSTDHSNIKTYNMKFAATLVAAASAAGMGSANDAGAVLTNCGAGSNGVATCWEAYASFVPTANQTLGGDFTGPYGTEWDLQKSAGDCGLTISDAANNMQNATCAISFTAGANVNVGNSAFVYDANTIAGLDFSSEVSAVSTWAATKDVNVTDTSIGDCFTSGNNRQASIASCTQTPSGESVTKTMIMFTNNHAGEMNNFAIGNY